MERPKGLREQQSKAGAWRNGDAPNTPFSSGPSTSSWRDMKGSASRGGTAHTQLPRFPGSLCDPPAHAWPAAVLSPSQRGRPEPLSHQDAGSFPRGGGRFPGSCREPWSQTGDLAQSLDFGHHLPCVCRPSSSTLLTSSKILPFCSRMMNEHHHGPETTRPRAREADPHALKELLKGRSSEEHDTGIKTAPELRARTTPWGTLFSRWCRDKPAAGDSQAER